MKTKQLKELLNKINWDDKFQTNNRLTWTLDEIVLLDKHVRRCTYVQHKIWKEINTLGNQLCEDLKIKQANILLCGPITNLYISHGEWDKVLKQTDVKILRIYKDSRFNRSKVLISLSVDYHIHYSDENTIKNCIIHNKGQRIYNLYNRHIQILYYSNILNGIIYNYLEQEWLPNQKINKDSTYNIIDIMLNNRHIFYETSPNYYGFKLLDYEDIKLIQLNIGEPSG